MFRISDETYEKLQLILEKQYGQDINIEDVKEIGDGLIDFCVLLEGFNKNEEAK